MGKFLRLNAAVLTIEIRMRIRRLRRKKMRRLFRRRRRLRIIVCLIWIRVLVGSLSTVKVAESRVQASTTGIRAHRHFAWTKLGKQLRFPSRRSTRYPNSTRAIWLTIDVLKWTCAGQTLWNYCRKNGRFTPTINTFGWFSVISSFK